MRPLDSRHGETGNSEFLANRRHEFFLDELKLQHQLAQGLRHRAQIGGCAIVQQGRQAMLWSHLLRNQHAVLGNRIEVTCLPVKTTLIGQAMRDIADFDLGWIGRQEMELSTAVGQDTTLVAQAIVGQDHAYLL
ncbi:MAG TPA: hypothetical protein VJ572_09020, partial [Azonexus sp.]|nr:hypothetical protein [Azonexus sp.]